MPDYRGRSGASARERERLFTRLAGQGLTTKTIAERMGITRRSVQRIRRRLEAAQ